MHTLRENMPRVFASIEGITLHESIIMHLESKYSLVGIYPPRNTVDPKRSEGSTESSPRTSPSRTQEST